MSHIKQLSNRFDYSLIHAGEFVEIYFTCSRSPMDFWNYPWSPPLHIQPPKAYAAITISSTNRDVESAVANALSPLRLSHFGTNCS